MSIAKSGIALLLFFSILLSMASPTGASSTDSSTATTDGLLKWLKQNRDQKTGLPYSHIGDKRFENWSFTYDAAVVALAYIAVGEIDDAKKIVNFYIKTPEVKRLNGFIEAFVSSPSFQGKDYSVRTGANLWLGIASFHLYKKTGELKYLRFAESIANFAIDLQNKDTTSQNYGAITLGPAGDPAYKGDQHISHDFKLLRFTKIYSTEINIDAYSLLNLLNQNKKNPRYAEAKNWVLNWLEKRAYNFVDHRFNRGFEDNNVATDVQSWGISALGVEILNTFESNTLKDNTSEKIIHFVEKNCMATDTFEKPDGTTVTVQGVDFVDNKRAKSLNRKPLVSPEWTFQLINAYSKLSRYFMLNGQPDKAARYKKKREQLINSMIKLAINNNGALAYPYATQADAKLGHENATPGKGSFSVIGVAYGILALQDFDPLGVLSQEKQTHSR